MREVAYVFERFPSFGQTFCYREVAELARQGWTPRIFSIRRPVDEPAERWNPAILEAVEYLPEENALVPAIERTLRHDRSLAEVRKTIEAWGRQPDFLRLYQATYVGLRLREAGITRVHAHFAGMATRTAYWLHKFFGVRYSFTAHANDIFAPREFAIGLDKLVADSVAVVSVSDYGAEFLRRRFPAVSPKIVRIYNGIELAAFLPATFPPGVASIVSVGRLIEKKGFTDLVTACAILKSRGVPLRCEIVGEGPLAPALQSQIDANGVGDVVRLVGAESQAQIAPRLAAATVFALPCTTGKDGGMDNLPTVIMEAMAAGLPVVSTRLAGVPEMVREGITGTLVEPDSPNEFADALLAFVRDPARARAFGAAGRELAQERFSVEGSVRELIELFDRRD